MYSTMTHPSYEKLFLMEFLVDSVYISGSSLDLDPGTKSRLRETCVMFQFLDHQPMLVCEEDFSKGPGASPGGDTQLSFNSGKSCIFSMPSSLIPSLPYKFDVTVTVVRKAAEDRIAIGCTCISLGDSFAALVHSSVDEPDLPLQKTKAGTFDVLDQGGRKIGYVTAFLRLSCFGQLIVTQFQVGGGRNDFMFRGMEPRQVVELPGDASKAPKIEVDPNYAPPSYAPPKRRDETVDPCSGLGDTGNYYDDYCGYADPPPPPPQEPEGNYKEIVAEVRGHALYIRVPMKSKKEKGAACKKKVVEQIEGPVCKFAPTLNLCECDFPVPPEATPRCGPMC